MTKSASAKSSKDAAGAAGAEDPAAGVDDGAASGALAATGLTAARYGARATGVGFRTATAPREAVVPNRRTNIVDGDGCDSRNVEK